MQTHPCWSFSHLVNNCLKLGLFICKFRPCMLWNQKRYNHKSMSLSAATVAHRGHAANKKTCYRWNKVAANDSNMLIASNLCIVRWMEIFFQVKINFEDTMWGHMQCTQVLEGKENEKLNYTSVYAFSFIFFHISMASYIQKFIS